eukprot:7285513-Lingulodinium_polyedra.AAC.1
MSQSPGPRTRRRNVVKSNTARFLRNAVRPKRPGKSELGTDGIFRLPSLLVSKPKCCMATGNAQS